MLGGIGGGLAALGVGAVIGGVSAVTNAVGGMISAGFEASKTFEMMGLSLQSLAAREAINAGQATDMAEAFAMSKDRAAELLDWVKQTAIQSPFTAEGVQKAFQTAMAYGFTTEQAQRLTQATLDYAAGAGVGEAATGQMTLALGQMAAKGKVSQQELLQLVNAGVPALQYLAKHFGKTTQEMQKMIEKGAIPADEAIEAITQGMEKDFGGAAARSQDTLQGLISSMGDIKDMALDAFFGSMFKEGLGPVLSDFAGWVQTEGIPLLQEWGTEIGNTAGGLSHLAAGLFESLVTGKSWNSELGQANATLIGFNGLIVGAAGFVSDFGNIVRGVAAGDLTPFTEALAQMIPPETMAQLEKIGGDIGPGLESLATSAGKFAETITPGLVENVNAFFGGLTGGFMDTLTNNAPQIGQSLEGIAGSLDKLGPAINDALIAAAPFTEFIGTLAGSTLSTAVTLVAGLVDSLLKVATGDIQGAWTGLGETVKTSLDGITQAFGGVNFDDVIATWKGNFDNLGLIISGTVKNIATNIGNSAGDFGNAAAQVAASLIGGFVTGAIEFPGKVAETISGAINSGNTEAGKGSGVGDTLVSGIAGGISAGKSKAVGAAVEAVEAAIAAAWAAADAASPSRIMHYFGDEILMGGMAGGITAGGQTAADNMGAAVGNVIGAAQGASIPTLGAGLQAATPGAGGGINITIYQTVETLDLSRIAPELLDAVEAELNKLGLTLKRSTA